MASASAVAALTLLAKALGFGEKLVLGAHAGVGPAVDAWFGVFGVVFVLFVIIDDVVAPVFLTRYVYLLEAGDRAGALRYRRRTALGATIFLCAAAALAFAGPHLVLELLAPGFRGERLQMATELLRWSLPGAVLLALSALSAVALNAHGHFALPTAGTVLQKLVMVAGFALLIPIWGITGAAMAFGAGCLGLMGIHAWGLRRFGPPVIEAGSPTRPPVSSLRLMVPLALGTLFAQGSGLVDTGWASTLPEGTVAALGYARKLIDASVLLVPGVLGLVVFPRLSALGARGEDEALLGLTMQLIGVAFVLFLPTTVVLFVAPDLVVETIFGRGRFQAEAVALTAPLLGVFALGMCAFAADILLIRAFFATLDTLTPVAIGVVFAGLNIWLTFELTPRIGAVAIPLALVLQKLLKTSTMFAVLAHRHPGAWRARILPNLLWMVIATAAFTATFVSIPKASLGQLILAGLLSGLVYLAVGAGWWALRPRRPSPSEG